MIMKAWRPRGDKAMRLASCADHFVQNGAINNPAMLANTKKLESMFSLHRHLDGVAGLVFGARGRWWGWLRRWFVAATLGVAGTVALLGGCGR